MTNENAIARLTGFAMMATIVIGIINATVVSPGIDINLSADVTATAQEMLRSAPRLKARGWLLMALFGLEVLGLVGFYLLLNKFGPLLSAWALIIGGVAAAFALTASVNAFAASEIADGALPGTTGLDHAAMEAVANYSSFHLALVISSVSNVVFYGLFLKSRLIPAPIAVLGLGASLFVALAIVGRDFVAILGAGSVTTAFMASNLLAIVATAVYLVLRGVRTESGN